ncbi:MAG: alpha/beta hydrolase [Bacteroidia bacterium]|nr:alpha/beta hydrolase [Bacteroidia bacterium]
MKKLPMLFSSLFLVAIIACEETPAEPEPPTPPKSGISRGAGDISFSDYSPISNRPLKVWYYAPQDSIKELEVVFVMHGLGRNGRDYRDNWIGLANQYNCLILVPEFSDAQYPGSRSYNLGNLFDENDQPNAEEEWSFSIMDALFSHIQEEYSVRADSFYLFGHSAGSQFVHRYLLFRPENKAKMAIAANAGWYTLPKLDEAFPYGLQDAPATEENIRKAFAKRMLILLGTEDNDPNASSLRKTPEANAQGAHRFARGNFFFQLARDQATQLNTPFNWSLQTVEGVGHSNSLMAAPAAEQFFK